LSLGSLLAARSQRIEPQTHPHWLKLASDDPDQA